MARAPFRILVFPYKMLDDNPMYALFRRSDEGFWQGIAGAPGCPTLPPEA